jgi:hypothetical protein
MENMVLQGCQPDFNAEVNDSVVCSWNPEPVGMHIRYNKRLINFKEAHFRSNNYFMLSFDV